MNIKPHFVICIELNNFEEGLRVKIEPHLRNTHIMFCGAILHQSEPASCSVQKSTAAAVPRVLDLALAFRYSRLAFLQRAITFLIMRCVHNCRSLHAPLPQWGTQALLCHIVYIKRLQLVTYCSFIIKKRHAPIWYCTHTAFYTLESLFALAITNHSVKRGRVCSALDYWRCRFSKVRRLNTQWRRLSKAK